MKTHKKTVDDYRKLTDRFKWCISFASFQLLLTAGQQKVGRGKVNVTRLRNRSFSKSHSTNGRHVRLGSEHVQRNAQCAANLTHFTQALLIIGSGTSNENRHIVLDQFRLIFTQCRYDA